MEKIHTTDQQGGKLTTALIIVCGVCALVASLLSFVAIWLQWKNYRKPLLQRYVVRILLMVPIYAASSWGGLMSVTAALYLDPLRDIYEAFTIYTFLQLLINFIGGERALIIMMNGRAPKSHAWPLNHCLPKVDISDPHTFLAIKRGILQYAWLKPILSLATIIMKAAGVYNESDLSASSGYLWIGILYNLSVTLSLYSLAMFWVCMSHDLQPFRPVPKFLCIKLIIFASYWQGFFLSILQYEGAIPSGFGYGSADNVAAAIQNALICCEMPLFAISHWYAFSWHDYADVTISAARMPVKFAARDSFGVRDLIEDTKETFVGKNYEYRAFDSGDNVIAHEESDSRVARLREGMRYARGGKGKYWIPKPGEVNSRTPLLGNAGGSSSNDESSPDRRGATYGELDGGIVDHEDERLYTSARALEFGDWNYPVITAHVPSKDRWIHGNPGIITPATNRHLLHPTDLGDKRRKHRIEQRFKNKSRTGSNSLSDAANDEGDEGDGEPEQHTRAPVVANLIREDSSTSSKSAKSGRSQLVDLVVEDSEAEEAEAVRARKEGGSEWNRDTPRHFVRTYDDEDHGEAIRHGFEPSNLEADYQIGSDGDENVDEDDNNGKKKASSSKPQAPPGGATYDDMADEHPNVWGSPSNK